jgi:protocatechuate 3,4-dioxygenase beta subunit
MLTSRRSFFAMCGAIVLPGVSLGELIITPWQGEGPFYPDRIPEDTDNDLVKNGHSTIEAGGKILNLMGSLVNHDSKPIKGMTAEIWQTDMNGVYLHTGSFGSKMRDDQFQGFGRSITDRNGHFSFRTIIPVEYPGRTPHIHLKLWNERENFLTTQLYIQGHSLNKEDFLFKRMTLAEQKINSMKLLPAQTNDSKEYITFVRLVVFS